MRPKISIAKRLRHIYKANQCSDISDVETALNDLRDLARLNDYDYTHMMRMRLVSLNKKLNKLQSKK